MGPTRKPPAESSQAILPPPGADRVHIDHGYANRITVHQTIRAHEGLALTNQRDVATRAANVHRDQIGYSGGRPCDLCADDARSRPREKQAHWPSACNGRNHEATARLDDLQRRSDSGGRESPLKATEIPIDDWFDICIESRHNRSFILPECRIDFMRHAHKNVRKFRLDNFPGPTLMRRIPEGKKKTNRDCLHTEFHKPACGSAYIVFVQGLDHLALRVDTFPDLNTTLAWREKSGCLGLQKNVIHLVTHLSPNLQHIAKTGSRQ